MSKLSNSQKSKVLHRIYTLIKFLDENAEIERDSLHARYQVNKYGIRVRFNQKKVIILKNKLVDRLCEEFNLVHSNKALGIYQEKDNKMAISINEQDMNYFGTDEILIDVTIY